MNDLKKTPLGISGLSLSVASLGILLRPLGETFHYFCGLLSGIILCFFLLKVIIDFRKVAEELKASVPLSLLPTSTMTLMLLCTYLYPFFSDIADGLWFVAVIVHLLIMTLFIKRFIFRPTLQNVYPSWFVVGIGIIIATISSTTMHTQLLGQVFFYIGFVVYIVLLPLIIYRMIKLRPLPEPIRPTTAIFVAPPSMCLVGYCTVSATPALWLVCILLGVICVSYLFVSVRMVRLLQLRFYPSYAAFTFPYVIAATAIKTADGVLEANGIDLLAPVVPVTEVIAAAMVLYVLIRYVLHYNA